MSDDTSDSIQRATPAITPLSSFNSQTSFDSDLTIQLETKRLTPNQLNQLEQRIRTEYETLNKREVDYCYYIADISFAKRAAINLEKSPHGLCVFERKKTIFI